MQYSSPQSYCLFMLISYPHGPHKHNMVNHIGHIICILYLYIYIYIYIILFLVYYYTPYGDINDIILMGYLSILFCSAQEMENELWDMATAKDPTSIYLYIYICTCSGVSSDNVGLLTAQHVQFLSEPYL